jgi:tetratricopeptide (TPR) repeat protein
MRRWICYVLVAVCGGLASAGSRADSSERSADRTRGVPSRAEIRNQDIGFYQTRVERDPRSARDFAQLSGLYLQRAREAGDNEDLVRAERLARHSLKLRSSRNEAALGILASALLSQHRFDDALGVATELVAQDSGSVGGRALLAETQLELGRYREAARTLGTLTMYRSDLSVAPRLARWEELRGRPEAARRLLRSARDEAARRHALPREQLAWFHLRLADLALRYGHLSEAEQELGKGLDIAPQDYRLLGTKARLATVRHRWSDAIAAGETAIAQTLDPVTLGLLGEAYLAAGDSAKAAAYYRAVELTVLRQPGPFHRAWSLFLLDHQREIPTVLAKVRDELRTRRDIYGYDLFAWALYRSGLYRDAREAMRSALALGTRDAMIFFHAGMIEHALGNQAAARAYLTAALETNPFWHPDQSATARAVLDSIADR